MTDRAWIIVNRDNLLHNVREIQKIMEPGCKLMAVVKTNAYGHGSIGIAGCLQGAGIKDYAVATVWEGMELRANGIEGNILVLGYTDPKLAGELAEFDLTQTVIGYEYGKELNSRKIPVKVHLKIDTGMHRLGTDAKNIEEIRELFQLEYLKIKGMFTHLCAADSREAGDICFTNGQIEEFYRLVNSLKGIGLSVPVHIQSTYGLLNYSGLPCDYARIGMGIYGSLSSAGDKTVLEPELRPVLTLKSRLVLIRKLSDRENAGYGRAYQAEGDRTIGILAIGYGDGYPRELSGGRGEAIIKGVKVPVIGRICMDQLMVDLTEVSGVQRGDEAILIGSSGEAAITAAEVADRGGTIANELLSRLGARLPRI